MRARGFSGEGSVRRRERGGDGGGRGGGTTEAAGARSRARRRTLRMSFTPWWSFFRRFSSVTSSPELSRRGFHFGHRFPWGPIAPGASLPIAPESCARRSGPRGPPTRNEFFARRVAADFPGSMFLDCRSRDLRFPDAAARPELGTFSGNLSRDGTGRSQFDANLSRSAIRSRRFSPASCRFTRCPPPRAARFDRPGITPCASPATRAPWCARAFGTPRASSDGL